MNLLLLILIITIIRYLYLKYIVFHIDINSYLLLFIIIFFISYNINKNLYLSFTLSLLVFFSRTVYRYLTDSESLSVENYTSLKNTSLFMLALIFPYIINKYKNFINIKSVKYINFILVGYIIISCCEYLLYKMYYHRNGIIKKGNFNTTFLGADEWFNTNIKFN